MSLQKQRELLIVKGSGRQECAMLRFCVKQRDRKMFLKMFKAFYKTSTYNLVMCKGLVSFLSIWDRAGVCNCCRRGERMWMRGREILPSFSTAATAVAIVAVVCSRVSSAQGQQPHWRSPVGANPKVLFVPLASQYIHIGHRVVLALALVPKGAGEVVQGSTILITPLAPSPPASMHSLLQHCSAQILWQEMGRGIKNRV